ISFQTIPSSAPSRWRAINFNAILLDSTIAKATKFGILADCQGRVQGLWLSFTCESRAEQDIKKSMGLDIHTIMASFEQLVRSIKPQLRSLHAEFSTISIAQAREMGLDQGWVEKIEQISSFHRQLFMVHQVEYGPNTLKELDVVLSVQGKTI